MAHDLLSRIAGREALRRIAPGAFDAALPVLAAYRDPEFLASLAETPRGWDRYIDFWA
jgi:hypothetical protein